ncbi:MAG: endolytic transglycosylase MltG [Clostridia bacterium]|nr:endolytic transglycosylase MltG [Clostridia bacterium]
MNVLIACQAREYASSASKTAALHLRDELRAQGMRVFLDAYSDRQVMQDEELSTRIQSVIRRADAMILVMENAQSFYASRLYDQWQTFEQENLTGLFAVYALPTLDVRALPVEFAQRYIVYDEPGAMTYLAEQLMNELLVQPEHPALQTKKPAAETQKPQKKKRRWILPLVLTAALIGGAAVGIPKYLQKKEEARIAAELAAKQEEERIAREQAEYEEQHRTMQVTIIEGSTVEQMASQLEEEIRAEGGEFSADTFLSMCRTGEEFTSYSFVADAVAHTNASERFYALEGYLFPDTYEIYVHTDERTVIEKMLTRFDEIISREEIALALKTSGMTVDDVVTLASVVQKEGTSSSFHQISAVFHNRLSAGMMLQSDVTAQYVTGKQSLSMSLDDVSVDSPYNTYVTQGLPAGPIANPGAAALYAAAAPDQEMIEGGYYYFVLTDPATGVIAYSKTYAEHEAIANQYSHLW